LAALLAVPTGVLAAAQERQPMPDRQQQQQQQEGEPRIEAKADQVLHNMSNYVTSMQSFQVEAASIDEKVTSDGIKVQELAQGKVTVQRPSSLRIDRLSGNGHASLASNGDDVTVMNTDHGVFGTMAAPESLDALVSVLRDKLHIEAPGGDFLADDPYAVITEGMKEGRYLGVEPVGEVMAHHLMFTREDTVTQLWVQDGPKPVPLRYVVTSRDMAGQPQFTLSLHGWRTHYDPPPNTFTLTPPRGARRLDLSAPSAQREPVAPSHEVTP
jgi:hypothetical protein